MCNYNPHVWAESLWNIKTMIFNINRGKMSSFHFFGEQRPLAVETAFGSRWAASADDSRFYYYSQWKHTQTATGEEYFFNPTTQTPFIIFREAYRPCKMKRIAWHFGQYSFFTFLPSYLRQIDSRQLARLRLPANTLKNSVINVSYLVCLIPKKSWHGKTTRLVIVVWMLEVGKIPVFKSRIRRNVTVVSLQSLKQSVQQYTTTL